MPLGYLRALTGLAQGQNQREQQDYERKQTETARQDRLQAAAAALMARQAETDYQRSRDQAADQRQGQQDLQKAYTDGYVPTEQLHTEGQQAQQAGSAMMAPGAATFDDTGIGTAMAGAGMQAAKAPTMLTYANTALSKGRNSATEQARYDNIEARKQDREAQVAGQTEAAKIAAQGRAEMARENMQGRKEIANIAAGARQGQNAQKLGPALQLSTKYEGQIKPFREQASSLAKIEALSGPDVAPTPQNDIALVYAFMRAQDPTSTVREGEYATAQNAAGVPDKVRNLVNQVAKGQRLNPSQRQEMLATSRRLIESQRAAAKSIADHYRGIANQYGLDPDMVVSDPFESLGAPPAPAVQQQAPRPTQQFAKPSPQAQSILNNLLKPGGA